jgi:hypothetical protein
MPAYFGSSDEDFRRGTLEGLMTQAELADAGAISGSFSEKTMEGLKRQARLLQRALLSGRMDFFVGKLPNGCRVTAAVMRQP